MYNVSSWIFTLPHLAFFFHEQSTAESGRQRQKNPAVRSTTAVGRRPQGLHDTGRTRRRTQLGPSYGEELRSRASVRETERLRGEGDCGQRGPVRAR